jgi:ubiquinone/menaquinone biosynthesis C-methylase UbiE
MSTSKVKLGLAAAILLGTLSIVALMRWNQSNSMNSISICAAGGGNTTQHNPAALQQLRAALQASRAETAALLLEVTAANRRCRNNGDDANSEGTIMRRSTGPLKRSTRPGYNPDKTFAIMKASLVGRVLDPTKAQEFVRFNKACIDAPYGLNVDCGRHSYMLETMIPILDEHKGAGWLTLGDGRFAFEGSYLHARGAHVHASDISDATLRVAERAGMIDEFSEQHGEYLSFEDDSFDFAFAKESLHHLPRPAMGIYEMLRVARRAALFIEPMATPYPAPFLNHSFEYHAMMGLTDTRHHFEAHSFKYTISAQEIVQMAIGLNMPLVAFRGVPDVSRRDIANMKAGDVRAHLERMRTLSYSAKANVFYSKLAIAMFWEMPSRSLQLSLSGGGWMLCPLPRFDPTMAKTYYSVPPAEVHLVHNATECTILVRQTQ